MFSNENLILPFKPKPNPVIDAFGHCLLVGSCFAEYMGKRFERAGFSSLVNPYGTLYNAQSIADMFERAAGSCDYKNEDFVLNGELWHTWEQHSSLSHTDPQTLHLMIRERLQMLRDSLKGPSYVFISLGAAAVYELPETRKIVANCHKHPNDIFQNRLMKTEEIKAALTKIYGIVKGFNAQNRIIFTISPVRHYKTGLIDNNRSKARLIEGLHSFLDETSDAIYFPAYELMIDHLRDYRFYGNDLVHPSEYASDLIFMAVQELLMTDQLRQVVEKVLAYRKMLEHRPMFPDTEAYHQFELKRDQLRVDLLTAHPDLDI